MTRAFALLLFAAPLRAQERAPAPASIKAVQRLGRAPVSRELLRVRLPRPAIRTLPNGLTLLVVEQHKLPTVEFSLWIQSGALDDPPEMPGLAQFTAEMLREGTLRRTSAQLAAEVDDLGATLEASAPFGQAISAVSASGLVEDAGRILELMADATLHPAFDPGELEKYKKRRLAELEELRADPKFLARERLYAALYRDSPPSRIAPTPASVKAATAERLRDYHARAYLPGNAILGVAGDVTLAEVQPLVEKYFGAWSGARKRRPYSFPAPKPGPRRVLLVDRPGSVQTQVLAGDLALRRTDPDFIPLTVANRVLGAGSSSRLFLRLREEKGYTYGAYSDFTADLYPGPFRAELAVRTAVTEPALRELLAEFDAIRRQGVPPEELDESRRAIVARFALSLEQPSTLLELWMKARYFGLSEDYWDRYTEEVSRTSPEALRAAALKYIDPDHLQIVCVGDAKAIGASLAAFGPVEVYGADGRREDAGPKRP